VLLSRERAAQKELALIVFSLVLVVISHAAALPVAMLVIALLMLVVECLNTAIERLCDKVEPKKSNAIKDIKDIAAVPSLILSIIYGMALAGFIYSLTLPSPLPF